MPTRLLLIADTHIPGRARSLPAQVLDEAERADVVVHAGDWVSVGVLDELETFGPVVGVYGNNDGDDLRQRLPEVAYLTLEGLHIAVVHETGTARGRETRMDAAFPDVDVVVFGHSHIPWDTVTPGGARLLNPGSPTDRRRQPDKTYMTAVADDKALAEVRLLTV